MRTTKHHGEITKVKNDIVQIEKTNQLKRNFNFVHMILNVTHCYRKIFIYKYKNCPKKRQYLSKY